MFSIFKKDPVKKLEKKYKILMEKARDVQRSGDLRAYAELIKESEEIQDQIFALKKVK